MRTTLIGLVVVLAGGCAHKKQSTIVGPGMNAKREANLLQLAGKELNCTSENMVGQFKESLEKNVHVYAVDGCTGHYEALLHCLGVCVWVELPDRRATFDLQCPAPNELKRTYLGNGMFGMTGCGKSITYVNSEGRWIANGPVSQ
jgi:hypothetical protein